MPQIQKGTIYSAINNQVNFTNLNNLVDASVLMVGAITEQTVLTPNTLQTTDSTIINDGGVIKQATVSDFLNSGIPITASVISGIANNDIVVTPNNGLSVVGSNYSSSNGLTVVVTTLVAHGLVVNNVVLISGAGTGYNGTFKVTAVTTLTFTYVMVTVATPTASPTACTYLKTASEIVNGNIIATQNSFVNGNIVGQGNLYIAGQTELANAPTVGGKSLPQLYDVVEITVPSVSWGNGNGNAAYTYDQMFLSSTYVKPADEIWIIEVDMKIMSMSGSSTNYVLLRGSNWKMETVATVGGAVALTNNWVQRVDNYVAGSVGASGNSSISLEQFSWKYVIPKLVAFDGKFKISAMQNIANGWNNQADGFTAISPVNAGASSTMAYWQGLATVAGANNIATNFPWRTTFRIFKHKTL